MISLNIFLTVGSFAFFIHLCGGGIAPVGSLCEIPPVQLLFVPLWTFADEVLFYNVHRLAHRRQIYNHPLFAHKMHHKFKVTSGWTSFYAHPADMLVAIIWAGLAMPAMQMGWLKHEVAAPVVAVFVFGATVTFIASHHTAAGEAGAEGMEHLQHHLRFNVNYGNFAIFDKLFGSYGTARRRAPCARPPSAGSPLPGRSRGPPRRAPKTQQGHGPVDVG